jgi:tetratricopeptide (TPR) repeat protein
MSEEKSDTVQAPGATKGMPIRLIVCLALVVIGGIVLLALPPREPSYQGKSLSYWLSPENWGRAESSNAVRTMGTNAIPTLLRLLKSKDSALIEKVSDLIDRQHYVHNPMVSADEQMRKAYLGLGMLGDIATNSVPALIEIYQHPPSLESKEIADGILKQLYPFSGVSNPYWVPTNDRVQWFMDAGITKYTQFPATDRGRKCADAIAAYSAAIRLDPTNAEAYSSRAEVKLELHDFAGTMADLNVALKLSPRNGPAYYLRGFCKLSAKDYNGADADFTTAISLDTNDAAMYNYRGLARASIRKWDEAIADFNKAVEMSPSQPEFYRDRAMAEGGQKNYEAALEDASKAISMNNKDPVTFLTRGRIENALKDYNSALADLNKAIAMKPKEQLSAYYAARATTWVYVDEFTNSATDLKTALQLDPNNFIAFLVRGVSHAKLGENDDALADFRRAAELAPEKRETWGILGLFQYRIGDWKSALVNCRKALAMAEPADKGDYDACVWLIRAQSGEEQTAGAELADYLKTLTDKQSNEWSAITARFFIGSIPESNFLALATSAAKRPSAVKVQICDSLYYAAMKRKIAGDQEGAAELFHKCVDTKYDNSMAYLNAKAELRKLRRDPEK